jgi:hypothetical protein
LPAQPYRIHGKDCASKQTYRWGQQDIAPWKEAQREIDDGAGMQTQTITQSGSWATASSTFIGWDPTFVAFWRALRRAEEEIFERLRTTVPASCYGLPVQDEIQAQWD